MGISLKQLWTVPKWVHDKVYVFWEGFKNMKKYPNFLVVRRLQLLLKLAMPMVLLVFLVGRYCTLLKLLNTEGYKKFRWIFRFLYFLKNMHFFSINYLHFIRHWLRFKTKLGWYFFIFLQPSQNVWTLSCSNFCAAQSCRKLMLTCPSTAPK